jgi:hypothetical protein
MFRRVADDRQQARLRVARRFEDIVEESHRTGRVRQCCQAGAMQRREQDARRDTDRFVR